MMAKAMIAAYRKARKEDGAVLVVTQSIGDVYASKNCEAIAANSAWQFILQQKTESIDSAIDSKQFKIEAYGQHMLKSVHTMPGKYSEIMVKRSDTDWGIVRLVVDNFHNVMFSTKGRHGTRFWTNSTKVLMPWKQLTTSLRVRRPTRNRCRRPLYTLNLAQRNLGFFGHTNIIRLLIGLLARVMIPSMAHLSY